MNLERLGLPRGGAVDTVRSDPKPLDWGSAHGTRRAQVAGDQLSDLVGDYRGTDAERLTVMEEHKNRWGRERIRLSTPSYGAFESAPFTPDFKLLEADQRTAKRAVREAWPGAPGSAGPSRTSPMVPGLGPEQPVAEVAQTRQDELPLVEAAVDGRGVDRHVGRRRLEAGDPLGSGHDRQEAHATRAQLGQPLDGEGGRAAGGQHGVEEEDDGVPEALRHPLVVSARHRRRFVTLQAEVADFGLGHQLKEPLEQSQSRPQHRHRHDTRHQPAHRGRLERRVDCVVAQRQISGGLRDQEEAGPTGEPAEDVTRRVTVPQPGEDVLHERVPDHSHVHRLRIIHDLPDRRAVAAGSGAVAA